MNAVERWVAKGSRLRIHARWLTLALALWLAASGTALAQRRKKEEAVAPTKSYVASYVILMMAVTGGLFAALRPTIRLDKIPEKIKDDD